VSKLDDWLDPARAAAREFIAQRGAAHARAVAHGIARELRALDARERLDVGTLRELDAGLARLQGGLSWTRLAAGAWLHPFAKSPPARAHLSRTGARDTRDWLATEAGRFTVNYGPASCVRVLLDQEGAQ
jgi:hypothetical protein